MSVILILIAFSLLIAGSFLIGFLWSVKTGQYDDDVTPSVRILFDEQTNTSNKQPNTKNTDTV
jgi:cbb3-type cytochrome oxidase maturation protein